MNLPATPFGLEPHRKAEWRIAVDGQLIADPAIRRRLISLTHIDQRGFEADTVDIEFNDHDGALALPRKGAILTLAFGWAGEGLADKGSFTVAEVSHRGAPDVLSVRATSADLAAGLSTQKERSWDQTTMGAIVQTIAGENGLKAVVHGDLAGIAIDHVDQTNESGASFLTRLGKRYDAIATVKNGHLIFTPAGAGMTVSGKPIPPLSITRSTGDNHRFLVADRNAYQGVRALYHDPDQALKGEVVWGDAEGGQEQPTAGANSGSGFERTADNVKTLRHVYSTKANATRAARAEWQRLQRGVASFTYYPGIGIPEAIPETPATLTGWKDEIDSTDWLVTRVTNTIDGNSGYSQTMEFEVKGG